MVGGRRSSATLTFKRYENGSGIVPKSCQKLGESAVDHLITVVN